MLGCKIYQFRSRWFKSKLGWNICKLIHKKVHWKCYPNDIKYHMTLINTIFSVVIWFINVDNVDTLEINTHLLHKIIECWFMGGMLILATFIILTDGLDKELSCSVGICNHSYENVHFLVKWLHRPSQLSWDLDLKWWKHFERICSTSLPQYLVIWRSVLN